MKELRKLCMHPLCDAEPKCIRFTNISEKPGRKVRQFCGSLRSQKGAKVYGISEEDHVSPYMEGMAFRYAEFKPYMIDEIYSNGFVVCHEC